MKIFRKRMPNGNLSPTYYYRVTINGKLHERSTGCKTESEANAFCSKYVNGMRQQTSAKAVVENFRDVLAGGKAISLDDAFARFLDKPQRRTPGAKTIQQKRSFWDDFAKFIREKHPRIETINQISVR